MNSSEPAHELLVLAEPAQSLQHIGRPHHQPEYCQHLQVCLIRHVLKFQVEHGGQVFAEVGGHHKTDHQGDYQEFQLSKLTKMSTCCS